MDQLCSQRCKLLAIAVVFAAFVSVALPGGAADIDHAPAPSPGKTDHRLDIVRSGQHLNLHIVNARLDEFVRALGDVLDFETIVVGDYTSSNPISLSMQKLPSATAVEQLLARANTMIVYDTPAQNQTRRIKQVWLLEAEDDFKLSGIESVSTPSPTADDTERYYVDMNSTDLKTRSEAALRLARQVATENTDTQSKEWALAELIQSLLHDPDALVRTRAATALGRARDARAVSALRSATYDEHFSVRSQSINALGVIGGAEATSILGAILTASGEVNDAERSIAAQALWKLNSDAAGYYLSIGANDDSQQIRRVSKQAPEFARPRPADQSAAPAQTQ